MRNKIALDPLNTTFLLGTLGLSLILVPMELAHSLRHWSEWMVCLGMVTTVGLAVTTGYHRLFSHRSFQAKWPVRLLLLCLGAAAFENSVLHWASDHRIHHRHVDGNRDPYDIGKGFWYAHWLWVMEAKNNPITGVADLEKDPLVRWQHRHHFLIGALVSCSVPAAVGLATGNLWGHLVIGVLLRVVITHHTTFFINSAAHCFGTRPYTDANSARDNWFMALFTYGEGFHNYHHMWQWDYRNGVRWYHWDPAKWLVGLLAWLGLAQGLRRVPEDVIHRARLAMEEKRLLARLASAPPQAATDLNRRVVMARQRLESALEALHRHKGEWESRRADWRLRKAEWKESLARYRAERKQAWEEWKAARLAVRKLAFT